MHSHQAIRDLYEISSVGLPGDAKISCCGCNQLHKDGFMAHAVANKLVCKAVCKNCVIQQAEVGEFHDIAFWDANGLIILLC